MVEPAIEWVALPLVVVLLAASAFFSSTEIAIFSLPADRPQSTGGDDGRTERLAALQEDPHRLLVTLLVGNTLVNVALSSVVTVAAATALPPGIAVVVATLGASTVVLVFGEILPKAYGLGHAETWSISSARPLAAVGLLLYPVVVVFDVVTRRLGALVGGSPAIERPYTD